MSKMAASKSLHINFEGKKRSVIANKKEIFDKMFINVYNLRKQKFSKKFLL